MPQDSILRALAKWRRGGSRRFWSSLEELIDEDGFRAWLDGEFPAASSMFDDPGRPQFLKLMGASLLLAGLTGCGESKLRSWRCPMSTSRMTSPRRAALLCDWRPV